MRLILFVALLVGASAYALARGGAPERWAAALQLGAFAIDDGIHRYIDGWGYASVAVGSLLLDLALLVALVLLAWRSTRFWPLWLAGWQAAAMMGHMAKALDPGMVALGYAFQAQIWAYPMLIAMAAGTWRHQRRIADGATDPAWKTSPA